MSKVDKIAVLVAGLTCGAWAFGNIPPPGKRMDTINLARTLLTTPGIDVSAEDVNQRDPFNPNKPRIEVQQDLPVPTPAVSAAERDVLLYAVNVITPSGTIKLGDTQLLLFGQKRLKVGDRIPIVFQGNSYELEIAGIERTSFTLRLNKEEITRPIKPVNKP